MKIQASRTWASTHAWTSKHPSPSTCHSTNLTQPMCEALRLQPTLGFPGEVVNFNLAVPDIRAIEGNYCLVHLARN